jgi:hypothetical protein
MSNNQEMTEREKLIELLVNGIYFAMREGIEAETIKQIVELVEKELQNDRPKRS